jgi:acetoin utilization deacetylase AcuC-like enzyme
MASGASGANACCRRSIPSVRSCSSSPPDWITRELVAIAKRHGDGRVVSMLEGGYDLAALREASVAHVGALLD